jgi:6-phosphogluconolactonase (cycloisomerase 2 family)
MMFALPSTKILYLEKELVEAIACLEMMVATYSLEQIQQQEVLLKLTF